MGAWSLAQAQSPGEDGLRRTVSAAGVSTTDAATGAQSVAGSARSMPGADASDASTAESHHKPSAHGPRPPRAALTLEDRVRLLSRNLELNPSQQARLRALLENQQREIRRLWIQGQSSVGDRVGPTLAILERTKDQIRAMLTEQQRAKYPAAVHREALAPAQADPEYWIGLTQPRARQSAESAN